MPLKFLLLQKRLKLTLPKETPNAPGKIEGNAIKVNPLTAGSVCSHEIFALTLSAK
jgi:hypothetical protein